MNTERLLERAPSFLVEEDPCLSWPETELVRQSGVKLYGRQQDRGR
jgi:hypothetical protein